MDEQREWYLALLDADPMDDDPLPDEAWDYPEEEEDGDQTLT